MFNTLTKTIKFKLVVFILIQLLSLGFLIKTFGSLIGVELSLIDKQIQYNTVALKESILKSIEISDRIVDFIGKDLSSNFYSLNEMQRYAYLKKYLFDNIISFSVYDKNGDLFANAYTYPLKKVNISDRDYFKSALKGYNRQYYGAYYGRVIDDWAYSFVRTLNNPDLSFNGVLVATMNINYFNDLCKVIDSNKYNTYIVNNENLYISRCGEISINKNHINKPILDIIADGEFKGLNLSSISDRYETKNNILFMSSIPNESGIKILTVTSKKEEYSLMYATIYQNSIILGFIILANILCFMLYVNSIFASIDRRKT